MGVVVALCVGCGDSAQIVVAGLDDAGLDGGGADGVDADEADVEAPPRPDARPGGSLVVRVMSIDDPLTIDVIAARAAPPDGIVQRARPEGAALVAVDLPGGGRAERSTDARGRARFDGIDWSRGTATATAWLDGALTLGSRVGIRAADGEVLLYVMRVPEDPPVEPAVRNALLVGQLLNATVPSPFVDSSEIYMFGPELGGALAYGPTPSDPRVDYAMGAPMGMELTLIAVQFLPQPRGAPNAMLWSSFRLGPFGYGVIPRDLDLAERVTPDHVHGTIDIPDPRAEARVEVRHGELGQLGLMQASAQPLGASRVDFEIELLRLLPDDQVFTRYSDGDAIANVPGYPPEGGQHVDWPEPPRVVEPPEGSPEPIPLHAPIRWTNGDAPAGALVVGSLYVGWIVWFPPGATQVTVPEPPSAAELDALLASPLAGDMPSPTARLVHCELGRGPIAGRCAREISSRRFAIDFAAGR